MRGAPAGGVGRAGDRPEHLHLLQVREGQNRAKNQNKQITAGTDVLRIQLVFRVGSFEAVKTHRWTFVVDVLQTHTHTQLITIHPWITCATQSLFILILATFATDNWTLSRNFGTPLPLERSSDVAELLVKLNQRIVARPAA